MKKINIKGTAISYVKTAIKYEIVDKNKYNQFLLSTWSIKKYFDRNIKSANIITRCEGNIKKGSCQFLNWKCANTINIKAMLVLLDLVNLPTIKLKRYIVRTIINNWTILTYKGLSKYKWNWYIKR